jgi:putative peptide zinc metalloprotease protein
MSDAIWLFGKIDNRSTPRLRPNLRWTQQNAVSQAWWILSDPISNQHFRCEHLEARFLQLLDGKKSIHEAVALLVKEFSASELRPGKIAAILQFAQANRLLMRHKSDANARIQQRTTSTNQLHLTSILHGLRRSLMSIIYQRVPLGNPNRMAAKLAAHTDWLFSATAVQLWTGFILTSFIALLISIFRIDQIAWNNALSLSAIRDWRLWIGCAATFVVTRVLHESAHASVCVRQGARCNQIGLLRIMLIAFPYVDVTDVWRIADRNARMAVFAAGIYVDLIVASVAVWIWQGTQPGYLHDLALMTVAMGMTGSLLFNANPLMKYDGYYILSEWLEVADLQRSSKTIYQSWFQRLMHSGQTHTSALSQRRGRLLLALAFYAPASHMYRMTLAFGILLATLLSFHAWHLTEIGWTVVSMSVVLGMAVSVDKQFRSNLVIQDSSQKHTDTSKTSHRMRAVFRCVLWAGAIACLSILAIVPLPQRVHAVGIIASQNRQAIYVNAPTTTLQSITQSDSTEIQFSRASVDAEMMRVRQSIEEIDAKRAALQQAVYFEPSLFGQLPQIDTIRQLRQRRYDFLDEHSADFHLSIDKSQRFLACPLTRPQIDQQSMSHGIMASEKLTPYTSILNKSLIGSRLERGTLIGYVYTHARKPSVEIHLNQIDRPSIHIGQIAKVRLQQYPSQVFVASIKSISQLIQEPAVPERQAAMDPNSVPEQAHYQVDLVLEESMDNLPFIENGNAEVVFATRGKSLYAHFVDYTNRLTR